MTVAKPSSNRSHHCGGRQSCACASSPTTNHSRQVMDRLYRQRYPDPPLNERVLRVDGESRRRMPHLHSPPPGYHAQSVDVPASTPLDRLGVELLALPPRQSFYGTDLVHSDVRFRPAVPAEHVYQFLPQMLQVG